MAAARSTSGQCRMTSARYGGLGPSAIASAVSFQNFAHGQPSDSALEEVIVTARRVEENLQDTPLAVSAFSGAALTERQVFETTELDQVVPNLQFADNENSGVAANR